MLANISLTFDNYSTTQLDDCPGDISYTCSITSNAEELNLTWTIIFSDGEILTLTHSNNSFYDLDSGLFLEEELGRNVTAMLQQHRNDFVESVLAFPALTLIGAIVKCSLQSLGFQVNISISGAYLDRRIRILRQFTCLFHSRQVK